MLTRRRKLALLGAAGGVITLGGAVLAGGALAQTPGTGASPNATPSAARQAQQQQHQAQQDQFLNDLAKNLGVDRGKLDTAIKTTDTQEVDAAVAAGKLTQAQGDAIKQNIASGKQPFGFGPDFGGPGGPDGRGGPGFGLPANARQAADDAITKALGGETQAQIRADLESGKTLDQIAQAHGTTVAQVQAAVTAAVKPLLDQAVTAGTMTATQEQQVLDAIKNGMGFGLIGGPRGGHGPGGPGRPNTSANPSATPTQ